MVVGSPVGVKRLGGGREGPSAALGQAVQPAFDALQRATVRQRDEQRVVARDRARRPRASGPCRARRRWRGRSPAAFAGRAAARPRGSRAAGRTGACLRRSSPDVSASMRRGGKRIRGRAVARDLDQPELRDVPADRRLGRTEAALAQCGRELKLGPDRALGDEVADRSLAELLHHLHAATLSARARRSARPPRARTGRGRRRRANGSAGSRA